MLFYKTSCSESEASSSSNELPEVADYQHMAKCWAPALTAAALLVLALRVEGLGCPLPDRSNASAGDLDQYVSLCAMCSHNEAAVRWNRTEDSDPIIWNFYIRFQCYDAEGDVLIPENRADDVDDCPWLGTIYPIIGGDTPLFGIASVGQELSNGTRCEFMLKYRVKIGTERAQLYTKRSSCTVDAECEEEECGIERVCTFSDGTRAAEDGLCTECSCIEGYTGPACTDIDECAGNNTCDDNADCLDTDGSYWCQCRPGFHGDGYNCTDIDECLNVTCGEDAECVNSEGNYSCQCLPGFTGDGHNCTDVDECLPGNSLCPSDAHCKNSDGSFTCKCEEGLVMTEGGNCTDIDECGNEIHMCSEFANCSNVFRGYECQCVLGFTGDGSICTDIDECSSELGGDLCTAESNTVCSNTLGNYTCTCQDGYSRDNAGICRKRMDPVLIVVITCVVLAFTLTVVLLSILLCLRIFRPITITFEELTIKEIDPFYSPKFVGGSLLSIHSEYEYLHDFRTTHSSEQLLEKGSSPEDEADPGISETDTSSGVSQEKVNLGREKGSDAPLLEEPPQEDVSQQSSCVSGNDDSLSAPYIDEQSVVQGGWCRTGSISPEIITDLSSTSENTAESVGGAENDSCSVETSSSPSPSASNKLPDLLQPCQMAPSGYVELGARVHAFEFCRPQLFPEEEQEDDSESGLPRGCASDVEEGEECPSKSGREYLNYDSSHGDYIFTVGDMAESTDFDVAI